MPNVKKNSVSNCVSSKGEKACGMEKIQKKQNLQSKNDNVEFASEFLEGETLEQTYQSEDTLNKTYNPNKQSLPLSERSAWH